MRMSGRLKRQNARVDERCVKPRTTCAQDRCGDGADAEGKDGVYEVVNKEGAGSGMGKHRAEFVIDLTSDAED